MDELDKCRKDSSIVQNSQKGGYIGPPLYMTINFASQGCIVFTSEQK